ncbi:MAG: bifunctional acetate--CoA ligase family protein/GNAT family N-acetyltransferase [Alphaproteobacteria bacterium]|nr:bifunctional acetate--CoA ligase family protein/GNAT family N-acetyltransferase [Alphaproteobacteria bacterium]MBV9693482.1 bifunctional acetate--CoA ligase family protein/GNAT family N-acetyltransferase [Alphaproteobacteria bacterium]
MTVRNLDAVFAPSAIALIGASERGGAIGTLVARNLLAGGFKGAIHFVNPQHTTLFGKPCYPDVASLPSVPDVAAICTPAPTVPSLVAELAARGTRGAIVITAGFRDAGNDAGRWLEREMLAAARPHLLRIVGPNGIGVLSTPSGINASFTPGAPLKGHVAFVAQSGAMVSTVLDWATARGIGFSHLVSLGDMADVDFGDMLDYLANDAVTHSILLYVEAVTQARKFLSAARAAARLKPVIAIKAGRAAAAARAAASHTGALAGNDAVYDAAFRRAGILRVFDLDEVFDAVETLGMAPRIAGERLAILTNGGGVGVLATDALIEQGGVLAPLPDATRAKLDAVLPVTWSHANPIDIIGDAPGARYAAALGIVLHDPGIDAVLALHCPTAVASGLEAAQAVAGAMAGQERPLLTNWLGAAEADAARRLFADAKIPTYETPEKAVRGFMHLVRYRRAQDQLMEVPDAQVDAAPDIVRARRAVDGALARGGGWLEPLAVQELFQSYGIALVRSALAADAGESARIAESFGGPVALKIVSPDITHKSDVGGVALDVMTAGAARLAADAMQARVRKAAPKARLDGFLVQEMIRRPGAYELILGMAQDATFGPFLLFGQGGVAVEQIADRALALPPLNAVLARDMIARTRIWRLLRGYRDRPAADAGAIVDTLLKLSQLVCDFDSIAEIDINPLLADDKGVIAVDARVRVEAPKGAAGARLAIVPYPRGLERSEDVPGLGRCLLRPVRPEDAPAFVAFFNRLNPQDIRLRFFSPLQALAPRLLARLTQIDYDRELAMVLFQDADLLGVSRLAADPDNLKAEFAVTVRSDLKGQGLGRLLLREIVDQARRRGTAEIFGCILEENAPMLALARELGFSLAHDGPGVWRATLRLANP